MFGFLKRRALPREHRPPLGRDERIVAWAMTSSAEAVVATNHGLWHGGSRTSWNDISKAVWDGSVLTITPSTVTDVRDGYSVIRDEPPVRYVLEAPGDLPHHVRLRVTSSVLHPRRFAAGWVAARRVPGVDGLSWIVRQDPGVDPAEHVTEADAAVEEAREAM